LAVNPDIRAYNANNIDICGDDVLLVVFLSHEIGFR
jgi:hypothetical protein